MRKYIDSRTFDIIENPTFFEVDCEIAEAISILNKKGYITTFSCSGHNKSGDLTETIKEPIELYEKWIERYGNDKNAHLIGRDNNYFYHKDEQEATNTYITFKEKYDFDFIPDGFEYSDYFEKYTISKMCLFFENGKRRLDNDIDEELKYNQQILLNWAKKLNKIE